MASKRARTGLLVATATAGIIGTFVLAGLGSQHLFERDHQTLVAPRPPRQSDGAAASEKFHVAAVMGGVECLQGGRLYALQAGDVLSPEDVIRTPPGARAVLKRGQSQLDLSENLELRVDALALETTRFDVIGGQGDVAAFVTGAGERIVIGAGHAEAVNVGPSHWVVRLLDQGRVGVSVGGGRVNFGAAGKTVTVPAGSLSTAEPGQPPRPPTTLPEALLLSVTWPELPAEAIEAEVRGQADPGTRVRINGGAVPVQGDGTFRARLKVGQAPRLEVQVDAEDLAGRQHSLKRSVTRAAPPPPRLQAADQDLWKE